MSMGWMPCSLTAATCSGLSRHVEEAAVDLGVEGLDAAVEHLGEAGEVADVGDLQAGVAEGLGGATGGDQFDAVSGEGAWRSRRDRFCR